MNTANYEVQYSKIMRARALKKEQITQRKAFLQHQYESSATLNKKDDKLNDIEAKIDNIDKDEQRTIVYYMSEISKAEDKFDKYKELCMEQITRIKEKNDAKRATLEQKKNISERTPDFSSDPTLIKLNIELTDADAAAERAERNMDECVQRDKNAQRDKELFEYLERTRADARASAAAKEAEEQKKSQQIDEEDKQDAKQYAKEVEDNRAKRQEEAVEINRRLFRQKTELKKVWTAKQEKKYQKLPKDDRIGFLDLSIEAVLNHLN